MSKAKTNEKTIGFIVAIDNQIYDLIRAYQQNAYALRKIPKDDFIKAYQEHGLHNIDFDKIFN